MGLQSRLKALTLDSVKMHRKSIVKKILNFCDFFLLFSDTLPLIYHKIQLYNITLNFIFTKSLYIKNIYQKIKILKKFVKFLIFLNQALPNKLYKFF